MRSRLNYSGFVIAGIGFFLTRFTVVLAIYEAPLPFYFGGIVPLLLGLGLAAFGVALVVADVDALLVRTAAIWCVIGTGTMFVLVVLTLLANNPDGMLDPAVLRSQTYLSNFLIGGSVGGTLTGLYAAHNRRQQADLRQQANRLEVLNRLLRHEVLNAVTVIKGYASLDGRPDETAWATVKDRSETIERTIDEVRYLAQGGHRVERQLGSTDVAECLADAIETVSEAHPDLSISTDIPPDLPTVAATSRLEEVFVRLLESASSQIDAAETAITVSVTSSVSRVNVAIDYKGDPLSAAQRALLEDGEIDRYDNPRTGFGLNVARLLVEGYRGSIETEANPSGTTITVALPRTRAGVPGIEATPFGISGLRSAAPMLLVSLVAGLLAGVAYGIVSESLGGSIAGIGVFYGTASPVVGWITHEFHSVVFGYVFLGLLAQAPTPYRNRVLGYVAIGLGWGVTLWLVAAGVIAPIWLQLLGIPAPIPAFSLDLLWSHIAWGITLGLLMFAGHRWLTPRLARAIDTW